MSRPVDFKAELDPDRFVVAPTDPVDERIEVGVLVVGAGPAGLACAIRFGQLLEEHPDVAERLGDVPLAVVEKGKQAGAHLLSGAVIRPGALERLFEGRGGLDDLPTYGTVDKEQVYVLTRDRALPIPTPPPMRNHGNVVVSLSQIGTLARRARRIRGRHVAAARPPRCSSSWSRAGWSGCARATRDAAPRARSWATSSRAATSSPASPCSPRAPRGTSPTSRSSTSACAVTRRRRSGSSV